MSSEETEKSFWEKYSPVFVFLSIILAFFVGVLWQKTRTTGQSGSGKVEGTKTTEATSPAVAQTGSVSMETIKGLFDKDVIKFGNKDRKVIFVEASDPSCPYCSIATGENSELNNSAGSQFKLVKDGGTYVAPVSEMKKLVDAGKASFIYLYFPGHGNGEMGAKAFYCAYELNKFWEVHSLLTSSAGYNLMNGEVKNDKTKSGVLSQFLKSAVDPAKMKECLDSGKYDNRLSTDAALAQSLGVQGTPGFWVNGVPFAGAYSFTDMEAAVKAALGE